MTTTNWRTQLDRRPDPAPETGMPDELDTTARQVRIDGRDDNPVRRLSGEPYTANGSRHYRIVCGGTLTSFGGAILTTRETTCGRCRGGGRRG